MKSSRTRANLWSVLFCLVLAGCGSDPGFNEATDFIPKEGAAQFINLISSSPELTINHGITAYNVAFPRASLIEARFEDSYDWEIGYLNENNQEVFVATGLNQLIQERVLTTFIITGTLAQPRVDIVDRAVTTADQLGEDQSEVWFVVNSERFSMVDIYLTEAGQDLASTAPTATLDSGTFTELITLTVSETMELRITEAGTTNLLFDSVTYGVPPLSRELYAIVDDFGPGSENHVDVIRSLTGITMSDESQSSLLRADNLSTSEPIDVTAGGTTFTGLGRGDNSSFQQVDASINALTVTDGNNTLLESDVTIVPSRYVSLFVFDDPDADAQPAAAAIQIVEELRPVTSRSLFQFINGTPDSVNLYALETGETVENSLPAINGLVFGSSGSTEVIPGQFEFVVQDVTTGEVLASLDASIEQGKTYALAFDTTGGLYLRTN